MGPGNASRGAYIISTLSALLLLSVIGYTGRNLVGAAVRTGEVSPRTPVSHDTYVYLCSLEVNEQNIARLDAAGVFDAASDALGATLRELRAANKRSECGSSE